MDVDHFKSLYWICYSFASVFCFGFLTTRHVILAPRPRTEQTDWTDWTCTLCTGRWSLNLTTWHSTHTSLIYAELTCSEAQPHPGPGARLHQVGLFSLPRLWVLWRLLNLQWKRATSHPVLSFPLRQVGFLNHDHIISDLRTEPELRSWCKHFPCPMKGLGGVRVTAFLGSILKSSLLSAKKCHRILTPPDD